MKNIMVLAVTLLVTLCHVRADFLRTEYKKVSSGGTRTWAGDVTPGNPCPHEGSTCQLTITPDEAGVIGEIVAAPGGGWLVTVDVPTLNFSPVGFWYPISLLAFPGFMFGPGEYQLRIVDWPGNPSYNGITVPCDGAVVDASGRITLFVP